MQNLRSSFHTFNFIHLITIGIIFFIASSLVFIARYRKTRHLVKPISISLAIILLGNELIYFLIIVYNQTWSYRWGLPLQICDLAIFAVCYSLITGLRKSNGRKSEKINGRAKPSTDYYIIYEKVSKHRQFIWELAYFWGLGATIQAILTPDLQETFPSYIYFKFFLGHGCIIIGAIFLAFGVRRPIHLKSVWRVWLATNIYALCILVFNRIFDTNYLYLCAKPHQSSILDFFGPWPFYLLGIEAILIITLSICYLPFYVAAKIRKE